MLKKEFRDALKLLVVCLMVFIAFPVLKVADFKLGYPEWDFSGPFDFLYTIFAVLFSSFSALSLFVSEKSNRALEYLLSLPVSRFRILVTKVSPRMFLLAAVYLGGVASGALDSPMSDGVSLLYLFFVALSVGMAVNSTFLGFVGVIILQLILSCTSLVIQVVHMRKSPSEEPASAVVSLLLPAMFLGLPAVAAFWASLKRMDLKPREYQVTQYLWIAIPPVLIALGFIALNYELLGSWFELF